MSNTADPLVGFSFALELDGVAVAMFKTVSGLESSIDVTELRQTTKEGKTVVLKIPGQVKFGDITFGRGLTKDTVLYDWYQQVVDGKIEESRKLGSVVVYDQMLEETARWNLERCWPSALKTGSLDAGGGDVVIEEMTIVTENLMRVKK